MAKDRYAVTCNGRSAFYACMYEDIRKCAMDNGWALGLHGSLSSDMDIMAMPWVDDAIPFEGLIDKISKLFKDNDMTETYVITYDEKPHDRIVATIPIYSDFYLDISTIIPLDKRTNIKLKNVNNPKAIPLSYSIEHLDYMFRCPVCGHQFEASKLTIENDKYVYLCPVCTTDLEV